MSFSFRIFRILLGMSLLLASKITLSNQSNDTIYKIIEITKKSHYYIIIAQRHDSLFKILSEKVEKKNIAGLERLKKGKYYNLEFERFYETPLILNYLDINLSRVKVKKYNREIARFHFRIYHSKYLKGIYYTFPLQEVE